jgi:alkylation response protein AidB-like acyl-CoA dehydrogenase
VRNHPTNLYRLPGETILGALAPTVLLGMARFAMPKFIEHTQNRRVIITGAPKAEYVPTQIRLAEAAAEIKSADLLMHEGLRECGEMLNSTGSTAEQRARIKWQGAYASELPARGGAPVRGVRRPCGLRRTPLQTAFRNVNVAAQHASFDFETCAEQYGRALLGVGSTQS